MGVHGLTTYLCDHRRVLSEQHELSSKALTGDLSTLPTPIVIDGWSFVYELHFGANLPWVYGGEYEQITELVTSIVQAWISVGLKPIFVFDGAYPVLKFATVADRILRSVIQPQLLFFRTSPASRSTPRFLHENRILPPLFDTACLHALYAIARSTKALEVHFADEEADPFAVDLAGRVGGYVAGNDSDFVILNSEGYRGYIPFKEMVWTGSIVQQEASTPSVPEDEDDDFQVVMKPKAKKKTVAPNLIGKGIIPPGDNASDLTLSMVSYSPSRLASHFDLPVSLLPLLGSFVGNDFSRQVSSGPHRNLQSLFFHRQSTLSQRIDLVASTLRSTLASSSPKRKQKEQVATVMDLIEKAANTLLSSVAHTMGSGEVESVVESVVEATLQYAIPKPENPHELWPTHTCPLHEPDLCPLLLSFSRLVSEEEEAIDEKSDVEVEKRREIRQLYVTAYRKGELSPMLVDVLSTGTYWSRLFLEHPDLETLSLTIGSRLRLWCYSILDDALGLPDREEDDVETGNEQNEPPAEDEDELVDVVEEDSDDDLLAPLRGELKRLRDPDDEAKAAAPESEPEQALQNPGLKTVTEYVRHGTRVAATDVTIPALSELLLTVPNYDIKNTVPLQLWPEDARLAVLLCATESQTPLVRALTPEQLIPVLAVRWVAQALRGWAPTENGVFKGFDTQRWTKHEARCFLASFSWPPTAATAVSTAQDTTLQGGDSNANTNPEEHPPIEDRNIQLMSQGLVALKSIEHLSQVLLLSERVPSVVHRLSGRRCHLYWTGAKSLNPEMIPPGLWDACVDGTENMFAVERWKKKQKKGTQERSGSPGVAVAAWNRAGTVKSGLFGKNVFAVLSDEMSVHPS